MLFNLQLKKYLRLKKSRQTLCTLCDSEFSNHISERVSKLTSIRSGEASSWDEALLGLLHLPQASLILYLEHTRPVTLGAAAPTNINLYS